MNERISLSGPGSVSGDTIGGSPIQRVIDRHRPVTDPGLRQRLAAAWIDHRVIGLNNQRAADRRRRGAEAGPEGSITKLQSAEFNQRLQKLAVDLEGANGVAWEGKGLTAEATFSFVGAPTDDPAHGGTRVPPRAGQHHRGRDVGDHAQHPRRARARAPEGARLSRATCRGRTSRARADGPAVYDRQAVPSPAAPCPRRR